MLEENENAKRTATPLVTKTQSSLFFLNISIGTRKSLTIDKYIRFRFYGKNETRVFL